MATTHRDIADQTQAQFFEQFPEHHDLVWFDVVTHDKTKISTWDRERLRNDIEWSRHYFERMRICVAQEWPEFTPAERRNLDPLTVATVLGRMAGYAAFIDEYERANER